MQGLIVMLELSFAVIKTPAGRIAFCTVRGLSWKMPRVTEVPHQDKQIITVRLEYLWEGCWRGICHAAQNVGEGDFSLTLS